MPPQSSPLLRPSCVLTLHVIAPDTAEISVFTMRPNGLYDRQRPRGELRIVYSDGYKIFYLPTLLLSASFASVH